MRKYGLEITSSKRVGSETTATVTMAFINSCTIDPDTIMCETGATSTNLFTFSPGGDAETVNISFYDQDIGDIDHLYMILDGSSTDAWFFTDFSIITANGEWRDCSFEFMNYWGLDNDCTPGGHPYVTIDVSNTSSICHNRASSGGGSEVDIPVSTTNGTRVYAAEFTTANRSGCASTNTFDWYFVHNCTFYENSGSYIHYCNTDKAIVSTITSTFEPAGAGETVYASFTDENIGELNYLHLDLSSGSDGWCFDKLSLLINDQTDEWVTCDFGTLLGWITIDTDCTNGFGYDSLAIDLLSEYTPCYYDDTISSPIAAPSAQPTIPTYTPTNMPTTLRNYSAVFTTLDRSGCDTSNTIDVAFINNCSYITAGEQLDTCNQDYAVSTSIQTFSPGGIGETVNVSFIDVDIGQVTHLYLEGSDDAWCFDQFSVLVDDTTNEWRTCSFEWMSYMTIDTDCSGNGGLSMITLDISNTSRLCQNSSTNITQQVANSLVFCSHKV